MESFEFLGGRYNRPEQIRSGPVQTFRAQNAADGRAVFIHRVSTTESPEEQSALLKLLTAALVRSADAKRLVLDFGEEHSHLYVITDDEPQCAQLRQWLEAAAGHAGPDFAADGAPKTASRDPGEFMRSIQARAAAAGAPSPLLPSSMPATPGEFTRLLNASDAERQMGAQLSPGTPRTPAVLQNPPPPPPAPAIGQAEPTPFFAPVQPPVEPKPAYNNSYVQPPNLTVPPPSPPPVLPLNPPPLKPIEVGGFTDLFARNEVPAAPKPVQSDLGFAKPDGPSSDFSSNAFNDKIDLVKPLPPAFQKEKDFVKVPGTVAASAPPVQPPNVEASPPDIPFLEDNESAESSDIEFSRMMQGAYTPPKPPASRPAAASRPPLNLIVPPRYVVVPPKPTSRWVFIIFAILISLAILLIRTIIVTTMKTW